MPCFSVLRMKNLCLLVLIFSIVLPSAHAQLETATLSGRVLDPSGAIVANARVTLVDIERESNILATTSSSGLYTFPSVRPGKYRMEIAAAGFKVVNITGLTVNVQDHLEQNFTLAVGSVSESVTVQAEASIVNTESAAVSTVVDRNFAENLPMNGRSFQTLIQLTPGVVLSTGNGYDQGQFNVNGQRGYSNYWMVDGVSANIGLNAGSVTAGGAAGALQGFGTQGGTNSLVSVDALQEFRLQTSTYAPEFGRTPGGQISIVTRSGTNQYHGTLFNYLRNDVLDANDWFANRAGIKKPQERQNDFGGTFSGPILKDKTFFFFSYEGLRLREPKVLVVSVPSVAARQNAIPEVQPFLNGYPLPNGADLGNDAAVFNDNHSNQSTLNASSLRVDHKLNTRISVFGRYNYSPSKIVSFGGSQIGRTQSVIHTGTIGTTWEISSSWLNDFRFNYSRTSAQSTSSLGTAGGAVPPPFSQLLPQGYTIENSAVGFNIFSIGGIVVGPGFDNLQRQMNVVDSISVRHGSHSIKAGVDFRRLTPILSSSAFIQRNNFVDVPSAENGTLASLSSTASTAAHLVFRNLSLFAQDTWQFRPRLTLTYGLRWDVDFSPSTTEGPALPAIQSCCDLTQLSLAQVGTPIFQTSYRNLAPRIGLAYQVLEKQNWQTVLRGGFGVFFDLSTQETGGLANYSNYPFGSNLSTGGTFPLDPAQTVPPPVSASQLASQVLVAVDPKLKQPYTLQWNVAMEQGLGTERSISVSYIGATGRRLTQSEFGLANSTILAGELITNAGTSDYHSLQVQFRQRPSRNLQILSSYTLAHSIDTASASSVGSTSNYYSPAYGAAQNRGSSDFDIRHGFTAALTYDIPLARTGGISKAIFGGWAVESIIQARSALPVNVDNSAQSFAFGFGQAFTDIRPDIVPGIPFYLYGPQYPGGKILNNTPDQGGPSCKGPFCPTSADPDTGLPLQGNLGRNALRGFGATQWDFAVHRGFPIRESMKLEFRAEMFNLLNHPNFGPPVSDMSSALFGQSTNMLGTALAQTGSALSPLYQIGGPRSIQLALKLAF